MGQLVLLTVVLSGATGGGGAQAAGQTLAPVGARVGTSFREFPVPSKKQLKRGGALLSKAVAALGGSAALDRLKTLQTHAVGTRRVPSGRDIEVRTNIQVEFPERYRQELVLPTATVVTLINGTRAYLVKDAGVLPLSHQERAALELLIHRSLYGVLRNRRDHDNPPAAVGHGVVAGQKVELVRLGFQPDAVTLAIEPKSAAILQLSYITKAGEAIGEFAVTFSDYRVVEGGFKFPFSMTATFGGQPAYTSRLEAVRVNGPIDPKLFEPPAPSLAPPPSPTPSPGGSL